MLRDAMPNGGQFKIETAVADAPDIGSGNGFHGWQMRFDSGLPIPAAAWIVVFFSTHLKPFFTTKEVGKRDRARSQHGLPESSAQNHGRHPASRASRVSVPAFEIYLPIAHEEKAEEHIKTGSA